MDEHTTDLERLSTKDIKKPIGEKSYKLEYLLRDSLSSSCTFLQKPYTAKKLLKAIHDVLE